MCDATGLGWAALIAAVVGTGVSATAAYQQGQTAKKTGEFNAEMASRERRDTLEQGAIAAAEKRERARQVMGTQAATIGAAGLDPNVGTPARLLDETTTMGELDALRTINNADRRGASLASQSELDLFQGKAAGRAGILSAGGTLLSGASNAYMTGRSVGLWGKK